MERDDELKLQLDLCIEDPHNVNDLLCLVAGRYKELRSQTYPRRHLGTNTTLAVSISRGILCFSEWTTARLIHSIFSERNVVERHSTPDESGAVFRHAMSGTTLEALSSLHGFWLARASETQGENCEG